MRLDASMARIEDVGLYIDNAGSSGSWKRIYLYAPGIHERGEDWAARVTLWHKGGYWTVQGGYGVHGYGALAYLIAMQVFGRIASDVSSTTSDEAQGLWEKFFNDPNIQHTRLPSRKGYDWKDMSPAVYYSYSLKTPMFTEQQLNDAKGRYEKMAANKDVRKMSKLNTFLNAATIRMVIHEQIDTGDIPEIDDMSDEDLMYIFDKACEGMGSMNISPLGDDINNVSPGTETTWRMDLLRSDEEFALDIGMALQKAIKDRKDNYGQGECQCAECACDKKEVAPEGSGDRDE